MSLPGAGALPPVDPSLEPPSIRKGDAAAKQAYDTGLMFEQVLVQQLSQELAASASSSDDGSTTDGSSGDGDSSSATAGMMGSDPASSTYAQLLPTALTNAVMSSGGTGMAYQIALSLDPKIGSK